MLDEYPSSTSLSSDMYASPCEGMLVNGVLVLISITIHDANMLPTIMIQEKESPDMHLLQPQWYV